MAALLVNSITIQTSSGPINFRGGTVIVDPSILAALTTAGAKFIDSNNPVAALALKMRLRGEDEFTVSEVLQAAYASWAESIGDGPFDTVLQSSSATTLATITIPDSSQATIEVYLAAKKQAADLQAFIARRVTYKRIGGTITIVDDVEELATKPTATAWAMSFVVGTSTILVQVTAAAAVRCKGEVKALLNTY